MSVSRDAVSPCEVWPEKRRPMLDVCFLVTQSHLVWPGMKTGNNGALVWDPAVGECKAVLTGEEKSPVRWASVARDGELLITCCADRTVHVWDLQMGKLLRTLPGESLSCIHGGKGLWETA
jgi:WD40 repeat protein